jgi:signal peptidase II
LEYAFLSFHPFKSKLAMVFFPTVICLALDLLTKALAKTNVDLMTIKPVTSFFNFVLAYNSGAAFSLLSGDGPGQGMKMVALSSLALIPLIWFYRLASPNDKGLLVSLGMVLGGALGNIHDRLRYQAVVDFLDFHWGTRHWPAFNVADITICVGLGLMILYTVLGMRIGQKMEKTKMERTKSGREVRSGRKRS